jgi:hypothetical protein
MNYQFSIEAVAASTASSSIFCDEGREKAAKGTLYLRRTCFGGAA